MKKARKVFALLISAIFALSLVPAGAWAATSSADAGHFGATGATKGKIEISDAEDGETYSLYKILDLASFSDGADEKDAGEHDQDAYSYVIKSDSAWLPFIEGYEVTSNTKAFSVDKNNPVTFEADGVDGNYYIVKLNGDPFGAPAGTTADATYDEDLREEYMHNSAEVQAFAQAALDFAKKAGDYSNRSGDIIGATQTATSSDNTVTWDDLDLGWYLVSTTLGSLVALDTTNNQVVMQEKNEKPSINKKVKNSTSSATRSETGNNYPANTWVDNTNHNIGETVHFMTEVSVRKNGVGYVLHDVMEKGLTYTKDSVTVFAKVENSSEYTQVEATNYTLTQEASANERLTDKCAFEIEFDDAFIATLNFDNTYTSVIQVEYDAVLNADAIIVGDTETTSGGESSISPLETGNDPDTSTSDAVSQLAGVDHNTDGRNTNSTILTYGAGSSTAWDDATVETYQFDVVKTKEASTGTTYPLLADATFELYADSSVSKNATTDKYEVNNNASAISLVADTEANKVYRTALSGETGVTQFTTDGIHALKFKGLKPGTYWLKEYAAPNGYNKLSDLVKVVIDDQGSVAAASGKVASSIDVEYSGNNSATSATDKIATATVSSSSYDTSAANQGGVQVINQAGTELPSTGGIGTTIFYVVGGILVAGSIVLLITKRRMANEA
ncbi:MAG: LPXTG cell wall anchor domain-containing protein [Atopobiaceae bacterium]|nr:LPXTG cell wall anchor domain-containing protein [Atopobiaceae bacterium]